MCFFKYLWFFAHGDEFVDSRTDWRGSVANSASQNTKSPGCTSSTPSSDSRDTSLARRRTSSRRASARTSSPRSSTSTAAPQTTRSGLYIVVVIILSFPTLQTVGLLYLFVSEARYSQFCPWAAVKSNKSNATWSRQKRFWINKLQPLFEGQLSSSVCLGLVCERLWWMDLTECDVLPQPPEFRPVFFPPSCIMHVFLYPCDGPRLNNYSKIWLKAVVAEEKSFLSNL